MRLGLVTDIHNDASKLARALAALERAGIDQLVTLGDTVDAFMPMHGAPEVAELLGRHQALGVWGNHDFCFCPGFGPLDQELVGRFQPVVLDAMARMQSHLLIDGALFTHRECFADPFDALELWGIRDGRLDLEAIAVQALAHHPARWQFLGHYHRWWAASSSGRLDWDGGAPLRLDRRGRYVIVLAPVLEGWCALLDTSEAVLEPIRSG